MYALLAAFVLAIVVPVDAVREGDYLVVRAKTEAHLDNVEITTEPKAEFNESGLNEWRGLTPATKGKFKATLCTPEACHIVKSSFETSGAGIAYILAIAGLAGLAMNFMPCVLPVLGLKLASLAKNGGKLPYILGVLVSFMVLATLSVAFGAGLSHMSMPAFRLAMVVVCGLMGLHLIHAWQMPAVGLGRLAGSTNSFVVGLMTVALGTSCSVPFLAPALVYCTAAGWLTTYLIFLVMGLGFCAPFILPIHKLMPKPGPWLEHFETACGGAMLVVSLWLLTTLGGVWAAGAMAAVMGGYGWLLVEDQLTTRPWGAPKVAIVIVISTVIALFGALRAPVSNLDTGTGPRAVVVTASWCVNCKTVEPLWRRETVQAAMKENGIEFHKLDWTDGDENVTQFMEVYGTPAVPFALIFNREGRMTVLQSIYTEADILRAIQ